MAHDVFVSYSSHDKPVADAICAFLEQRHIRCWIAPRDNLPGRDWAGEVVKAIRDARIMVFVFSGHANSSPQVKRELELAVDGALVVVPVRIENVLPQSSLEYFLGTPHWLDAITPPFESHLDRLADVVQSFLTATEPPSRRPDPPLHSDSHRARRIRYIAPLAVAIAALAIVLPLVLPGSSAKSSTVLPRIYSSGCPGANPATFEPRTILLCTTVGDGYSNLGVMQWSSWTTATAQGTGILAGSCAGTANGCPEAKVVLSDPVRTQTQGLVFASMSIQTSFGSQFSVDIGPQSCAKRPDC